LKVGLFFYVILQLH